MKLKLQCIISKFLLILFIGCNTDRPASIHTSVTLSNVDDTLYVNKAHKISGSNELLNPLYILNVNDDYIIITEQLKNNFIKIFSIPNFDISYSWGTFGRGPDEFMTFPTEIGTVNNQVYLFEIVSQKMRFYDVNDSGLILSKDEELLFDGQVAPLNRIRRINEKLYFSDFGTDIGTDADETNNEHIALQPNNENPIFTFGLYPETELTGYDRYATYFKTNWVKPNGESFVTTYISGENRIKIYDNNGQLKHSISIQDPTLEKDSLNKGDQFLYRTTAWASNEYIYFLGLYESNEKIYYDNPDPSLRTSIEVWDWEGNLVHRNSFDRFIMNFTVSEKHGKIYGFSPLALDTIFEYNLSLEIKAN